MEQESIVSHVSLIVVVMKNEGRIPHISGYNRLTLNPRMRRFAATTLEPEDLIKCILGNWYFSKLYLANAYLQIPLSTQSKPLTRLTTPRGLF